MNECFIIIFKIATLIKVTNMRKSIIFALFLLSLVATGCLDSNFEEPVVVLQVQDRIEVVSDNPDWTVVTATLDVKSNRSWSASLISDDLSWLAVRTPSRSNVGKITEVSSLELTFDNWDNPTQDRIATLHISTEEKAADIQVIQKALVPRLELVSDEVYSDIKADGDVIYVRFRSNWYWTAEFTEDTDAKVSIDVESGYQDGLIAVTIEQNEDDYPKYACLQIKPNAIGIDDLKVIIRQLPLIAEEL